jgi:hypothetical protein
MGRMKEIYMQVMHANDGQVPGELTISDMIKMKELEIYNWEEYEREQERIRVFRVKQENPREITKVAQTREYWEQELLAGQNRRKIKKDQQ